MQSITNTLTSVLSGIPAQTLRQSDLVSRLKISQLSFLMLIPVAVWALNGFMLGYLFLDLSLYASVAISAACALAVFIMDRSMLLDLSLPKEMATRLKVPAGRNRFGMVFRLIFGVISAVLGSLLLDTVMFKEDIALEAAKKRDAEVKTLQAEYLVEEMQKINPLLVAYQSNQGISQTYAEQAQHEMKGRYSGIIGYGGLVKGLLASSESYASQAARFHSNYLAGALAAPGIAQSRAIMEVNARQQQGLLTKMEHLHSFLFSHGAAMFSFILIFLFMFLAEMFFLIKKALTPQSALEERLAIEAAYERKFLGTGARGGEFMGAGTTLSQSPSRYSFVM